MTWRTLLLLAPMLVSLAGCAPEQVVGAGRPIADPQSTAVPAQGTPPMAGPSVRDPKDIRAIPPCDVLTDEQLRDLDLLPGTAQELKDPVTERCGWSSATDDTNPVGLEINSDTNLAVLDVVENLRGNFERYEPTEVAGHPAIRTDAVADNSCTLVIAIADHQGVSIGSNGANRPLPDPCDIPRRMGEFILSNLPPLT
ncbi:DUF3558 domain-containing protein [Pseudonocardia abyssalis]|uniref:DUF3558 domain-containing protein n=1 Tax=Pseudonocardia abyssalis TaxID=2792008 RepID=A0ABS6UKW1_9PSEU|nr:DUF3558 domain-containing protein [Pseudonocardia abyssalis]MBW0132893.1 DUF3558 domain-containing protein [Pseudonocardia abyssalis]